MLIDNISKSVLREIKPSKEEKEALDRLIEKVLAVAGKLSAGYGAEPMLAGSVSRGTWLSDRKEFDIFILFPERLEREQLEKLGLELGKKIIKRLGGKYRISYAEHPYVKGEIGEYSIDIVPCYRVASAESIKSSVDRTPFHVKYIDKNLDAGLSDQVRLLKQFCKAHGIYGADVVVQGFSGYLCELLIIRYGSFSGLLENSKAWEPGRLIDIEGYYENPDSARKLFPGQPLILIDPVDRKRNVAAAVSPEKFMLFRKRSGEFISDSSKKMFFPGKKRPISAKRAESLLKRRGTDFIMLSFRRPEAVDDIVYPQMRRFCGRIVSILAEYGFKVFRASFFIEKRCFALIELEVGRLPPVEKREGPHIFAVESSESFIKRYENDSSVVSGPFIEGDRWVFETKRKWRSAESKLKDSLRENKNILMKKGIPSEIAREISGGFSISGCDAILSKAKKNKGFLAFICSFLEPEPLH